MEKEGGGDNGPACCIDKGLREISLEKLHEELGRPGETLARLSPAAVLVSLLLIPTVPAGGHRVLP